VIFWAAQAILSPPQDLPGLLSAFLFQGQMPETPVVIGASPYEMDRGRLIKADDPRGDWPNSRVTSSTNKVSLGVSEPS